jgi:hypothetical protein
LLVVFEGLGLAGFGLVGLLSDEVLLLELPGVLLDELELLPVSLEPLPAAPVPLEPELLGVAGVDEDDGSDEDEDEPLP